MRKVSEYTAHAEECRRMASQMQNPEHKKQLAQMTDTWEMLAKARAKELELQGNEPPQPSRVYMPRDRECAFRKSVSQLAWGRWGP